MDRDREIRRQGPWRRCPDSDARFACQIAARDREFHIHSRILAILVFDFGFGQRGLCTSAPKNRLQAFVNEALFDKDRESTENFSFVSGVECQIGVLPIAKDAESLELFALDIHVLARKRFGLLPYFQGRKSA